MPCIKNASSHTTGKIYPSSIASLDPSCRLFKSGKEVVGESQDYNYTGMIDHAHVTNTFFDQERPQESGGSILGK